MDEHKKFLADRLLSEEQPITYRLLSRALDVHVNTAKEMLYDFHKYQNAQKANSIHATYLLLGTKASQPADGGDVEMTSSMPEHEPLSETVPTTTLTLAREENLTVALAEYQTVDSIHIYSLAPAPQRDLSLLSDLTKSLSEYSVKEDRIKAAEKYGVIANPQVRKRDRHARPRAPASSDTKVSKPTAPAVKPVVKSEPAPAASKIKQESAEEATSKTSTPASSAPKSTPSLKRGGSGGIMQSFAKAAAKPPKPKKEPEKEEPSMAMSDDGEADDDDIPAAKKPTKDAEAIRKARKEREDELRRMMEEDDDDDENEEGEEEEKEKSADEEMEEAPEPEPKIEEKPKEEGPSEVVSSTENGRRRGKRRVMQKKRILDDQGYMVTIQEAGWESFSEDEAPPPAKKQAPSSTPASSGAKAKKSAGKGGQQGNIMSFFGKK